MNESTLDIKQIVKTLKKRKGLIGKIFFAFVIVAAVISLLIPPTFEGELMLRVKQPKGLANSLLGDIAGGEFALPPFNNFLSGRSINFPSWPTAFSRCFGEVDLFMTELMPEQTEIAGAKPKPFGNDVVRQAIDKGGAHRFILALPFVDWFGEKAGISHASHYI